MVACSYLNDGDSTEDAGEDEGFLSSGESDNFSYLGHLGSEADSEHEIENDEPQANEQEVDETHDQHEDPEQDLHDEQEEIAA